MTGRNIPPLIRAIPRVANEYLLAVSPRPLASYTGNPMSLPVGEGGSFYPFVHGLFPGLSWSKLTPRTYRSVCSSSSPLSSSQWRTFWRLPLHHTVRNIWCSGPHKKVSSRSLLHSILPISFPTDSLDVWVTFWQTTFGSSPTLPNLCDPFYELSFPPCSSDIHAASFISCALSAIWRHHWSTVFDHIPFVQSNVLSTASSLVATFQAERTLDDFARSTDS
ncbi:hypothetical protein CLU79DRAFT_891173 [Phycomyces nitens]|nr:hypothetical protein CLU79DRAFT_891173 [Phycomyces nitens]